AQLFRLGVGDELAVGEDLEVTVGVFGEHLDQVRVHEGLAADNAEEDVAHRPGLAHQLVERGRLNDLLFGGDIDPATLAAQIAAVDDRHIKEGGEVFSSFQTP